MPKKLLFPEEISKKLSTRVGNACADWLAGMGEWPLSFPLGTPTEKDAVADAAKLRRWVDAWREWDAGSCELVWEVRTWPRLGRQTLPSAVLVHTAQAAADGIKQGARWRRAVTRYERLVVRWPQLKSHPAVCRQFDVLADYADDDFERLFSLLAWLDENPRSGRYLRQLPVVGLDTKWAHDRRSLIIDFLVAVRGGGDENGFHEICGLAKLPYRIRMRLLCPRLRAKFGGLGDIEAPLAEIASLDISPNRAVIVENLETGIALPDIPGCVALMKLGLAVGVVGKLPWVEGIPVVYWGDLDTHGFVILDRAREALPQLTSILMDIETVENYLSLAVMEPQQHRRVELAHLERFERTVYDGLYADVWGPKLRIEQERLPWSMAMKRLHEQLY